MLRLYGISLETITLHGPRKQNHFHGIERAKYISILYNRTRGYKIRTQVLSHSQF